MALNPPLFSNGFPVPFIDEVFILFRDAVKFQIDRVPGVKVKGWMYLTNIRMVFVSKSFSYDMPLLHIHGEHFPDYFRSTIYGHVQSVILEHERWSSLSTQTFEIEFKRKCGTFVNIFYNVINSVRRRYNPHHNLSPRHWPERFNPLLASRAPVDEMIRNVRVDREDPTTILLHEPNPALPRRFNYL